MAQDRARAAGEPRPAPARSGRAWFYAVGLVGLAIAIASIADMFSARPTTASCRCRTGRGGIEVRGVEPGGPAQSAGHPVGRLRPRHRDASSSSRRPTPPGSCASTGSARRCPTWCAAATALPDPPRQAGVLIRLGGTTYLYSAVLGFLFFLIGLFVFRNRPDDRAAQIFFLLCVLFLLFFVCRLRPASYWWIDVFVQNTGHGEPLPPAGRLPPLLPHLSATRRGSPSRAADEWTGEPPARWKVLAPGLPLGEPRPLLPDLLDSADRLSLRRLPAAPGANVSPILSGAPLSSWVLLGDYLVLGLIALAHSAFTLPDAGERRQAFHVLVGTILGTTPFVLLGIVLPSIFQQRRLRLLRASCR